MALDPRDPRVQEFFREQEEHPAEEKQKKRATKKAPEAESSAESVKTKKQRRPFKKKRAGIVLSRDLIMERVWDGYESESRTLDMHIKSLRKKLGDDGTMIQTVRGVGYKIGK